MASKAVGVPASSFASHSLNSCSSEANALGFGENLLVGGPHRGKPHKRWSIVCSSSSMRGEWNLLFLLGVYSRNQGRAFIFIWYVRFKSVGLFAYRSVGDEAREFA